MKTRVTPNKQLEMDILGEMKLGKNTVSNLRVLLSATLPVAYFYLLWGDKVKVKGADAFVIKTLENKWSVASRSLGLDSVRRASSS